MFFSLVCFIFIF